MVVTVMVCDQLPLLFLFIFSLTSPLSFMLTLKKNHIHPLILWYFRFDSQCFDFLFFFLALLSNFNLFSISFLYLWSYFNFYFYFQIWSSFS
jgi:hypothetical protein